MTRLIPFIVLLVAFSSCRKDKGGGAPLPSLGVNLSSPAVGQQSMYLRYKTTCDDLSGNFSYTFDTLLLTVVEQNNELHLEERFTENSPRYLNGETTPTVYPLQDIGDNILLTERSNSSLFYFYGNDTIRLQQSDQVPLFQNSCRLRQGSNPFIGNDIGKVASFGIGPVKVDNVMAASCVPVFFNIDGYLMYNSQQLHLSQVVIPNDVATMPDQVLGWELY